MTENKLNIQIKQQVRATAKGCCEYCLSQEKFATQRFSIEHIQPLSKGGQTALNNLALSCQGCNNYKYNKTEGEDSVSDRIISLYHPRQKHWQEHFNWNQDYTLIIGLTPTGRATVKVLRLNRENLVNLRRILYAAGEHPPKI